ncbi:MAG: recombinase RecQ, partial [Jiangellaceae bacterium]
LTDLGWGRRLRAALRPDVADGPADAALLAACVDVLRDWPWEQRPQAVISVPSRTRPLLVRSVAAHLAGIGRLADLGALDTSGARSAGGPGGNSAFRLRDVWEAWTVPAAMGADLAALGPSPVVLLVDDLVDSRWTVTVAGRLLRDAGAGAVLPFALAQAA